MLKIAKSKDKGQPQLVHQILKYESKKEIFQLFVSKVENQY